MKFLAILCSILIFTVICMADQLRKCHREKTLKKFVSWAVVYNSYLVYSHDMPLWMYIHNAQIKLCIHKEYRISSDEEWRLAKEILQEFQTDLMQTYFKGNLRLPKSKYEITGEHFFMYRLEHFLESHLRDSEFLGYDMRTYGGDSSYFLTDFSVVYYKLYYVIYLFCKNCKPLNESGMLYNDRVFLEWIEGKIQTANRKEDTDAM